MPDFTAMIMVTRTRGRHVLPHQDLWSPHLPPNRREPLGGRSAPTTGPRHPRTTRSTPTVRSTRCPAGLGRTPVPVRPTALRARPRTTTHHHHPPDRTGPDLRATLATDRLSAGHRATAGGPSLRVRCRTGDLPDRAAPLVRPRQRPGRRQVEGGLPD